MAENFSRPGRIARLLLINFAVLFGLLVLVEIFCQLFHPFHIEWVEGNDQTGFNILPNYIERYEYPEHPRGEVLYKSNNFGFREDRPTSLAKSDSVRIVVLGDSHTDGVCWNDESYANQLESLLNSQGGSRTFEVINAGTGKYSPFQYLRSYLYRILPLKPDMVIVGFYVGNDFFDMFRRDDRPSIGLDSEGNIVEYPPEFYFYAKPGFSKSRRSRSYVYYLLFGSRMMKRISYPISRGWVFYKTFSRDKSISTSAIVRYFRDLNAASSIHRQVTTQSVAQRIFFQRFPSKMEESQRLVSHVLQQLKEQTSADGARVLVAPIPTRYQIEPFRIEEASLFLAKFPYLENQQQFENRLYDQVLRICEEHGIDHLDLRQPLAKAAQKSQLYFDTDFHINPEAHRILAKALAGKISGLSSN